MPWRAHHGTMTRVSEATTDCGIDQELPIFTSLRGYKTASFTQDTVAGLTLGRCSFPRPSPTRRSAFARDRVVHGSARRCCSTRRSDRRSIWSSGRGDRGPVGRGGCGPGGPDNFLAFTAMLALATGVLAHLAGLLRLGFVANLIAEPVIEGLHHRAGADHHRRAVAQGLRLREGRAVLPAGLGIPSPSRRHAVANAHSWRPFLCNRRGVRQSRRAFPHRVAVAFGIAVVHLFDLSRRWSR